MLLLARCLDWVCLAFAAGVQDELRLNQLIVGSTQQSTDAHDATAQPIPLLGDGNGSVASVMDAYSSRR